MNVRLTRGDNATIAMVGLLMSGYTTKEVADMVHLSYRTVESKIGDLMLKFNTAKRDHLFGKLVKLGFIHAGSIIEKNEVENTKCNPCPPYTPGVLRSSNKVIFIN